MIWAFVIAYFLDEKYKSLPKIYVYFLFSYLGVSLYFSVILNLLTTIAQSLKICENGYSVAVSL